MTEAVAVAYLRLQRFTQPAQKQSPSAVVAPRKDPAAHPWSSRMRHLEAAQPNKTVDAVAVDLPPDQA
jgi:hypothetical protein